jgi:leucyl-tRNA synthetase
MDDCWCFFGTVPEWNLEGNPFEAWRRRPASRVHFHTGYDTYVYPHFFRFAGYFLYDLGLTPREEPIDFFPGHDVVTLDGRKLSKSHENAPDLDELLETWGADVVRLSVLSGSNPDREMAWSDSRLEHGRRILRTIRELDALYAACPDDTDRDPGDLSPSDTHTLERIDGFVDEYRVGAAIDLLYKASVGALRTGRKEKSAQLGLLCEELLSWWRIFVPEVPA